MKKYLPFFVIFILVAVHFYSNYNFLKKGADYGGTDTINHLINRIEIHNGIKKALSGHISGRERYLQIYNLLHQPGTWPPMIYLVSFFIGSVLNKSTFIVEMSNIFYVALLILGVYLLGKKLGGSNSGLLAAFITASFPIVSIWSKRYGLDLPLMSLTPWVMFALLNTAGFARAKSSALLGLLLGFVILFKIQILIFIFIPLVYVLWVQPDTYSFRIPKVSQLKNLIISLGLAALVSCLWWNRNHLYLSFNSFSDAITYSRPDGIHVPPCPVFSWEGFYYYFYDTKIGLFYLILFILAILHSVFRMEDRYARNILLIWVLFPYLLFSLMVCKHERWYVPSLPGIALFISLQVSRLRLHKAKCWLIVLILLFGLSGLIKDNFVFKKFANYNKSAISAGKVCALMRENKLYKRDTKLAICIFDGERITCPKLPLVNMRLHVCIYNIELNDPEVEIVNLLKDDRGVSDADFVILLLDFTPEEISTLAWQIKTLKGNILSEQQLSKMLDIHKFRLRNIMPQQEIPVIKKVRKSFYSGRTESYLFIPRIRLYYVLQIKKGTMTIEQCAQLLRLPKEEIVFWVDDYNRGGLYAISSRYKNVFLDFSKYYTQYYSQQLSEALNPLLKNFTVVEKNMNSDYAVIFLAKESAR